MPLKGGIKQRMKRDEESTTNRSEKPSKFLHKLWSKGKISTTDLQEGAATAAPIDPLCEEWSKIGASGSQPSHCQRDFFRVLGKKSSLPSLYVAEAPMWDHYTKTQVPGFLYFMLPFEVLAGMVTPNTVRAWAAMPDDKKMLGRTLNDWSRRTHTKNDGKILTMGVWGDAAPFHTRDSLYLMLWNILSGTSHKRFWFTVFTKRTTCDCGCRGRHTFEVVWEVMKWCLEAMQTRTVSSAMEASSLIRHWNCNI